MSQDQNNSTKDEPLNNLHDFAVKNRVSIWLCFCALIVASTMMHPTFGSLIAIFIVGFLVFAIRTVAHIEGRYHNDD